MFLKAPAVQQREVLFTSKMLFPEARLFDSEIPLDT